MNKKVTVGQPKG